jgi:hypothetical protein
MSEFRPSRTPLVSTGELELHQRDMTATFGADVTLETAQARLAEIGQWIPIDGDAALPLGELISFNSTGPLRLGYGAWRDLLLGLQFTNGRGELISAGGRTMKNVAGYDLTKFMVGSAGMFGKIVAVTVRTYRRPHAALLARFSPDGKILGRIVPTAFRPQWAMLTKDALYCGYLGDRRTIDYYKTSLPTTEPTEVLDRSIEEDITHRAQLWRADGAKTFRASAPPMKIMEFTSAIDGNPWVADAAFGIVLGSNVRDEQIASIEKIAASVGGSVRFCSRSDQTPSSPVVDFSTNPIERQIIEKLKHAFDPDGNLTPLPRQFR